MKRKLMPNIAIPLKPFQDTLGLAPPDGYFPPLSPGGFACLGMSLKG